MNTLRKWLSLAAVAVVALACGEAVPAGDPASPQDEGPDDATPQPRDDAPVPCTLLVPTAPLVWRDVGVGYEVRQPLRLANAGDEACALELAVSWNHAGAAGSTAVVAPHTSIEVPIAWSPSRAGADGGVLEVRSDSATWTIALEGEARAGCLVPSADVLDFGDVPPGCETGELALEVTNACSHPASWNKTALLREDASFVIRRSPAATSLGPGASTAFRLGFEPADTRSYAGSLSLVEFNRARVAVQLHGTGAYATRTDVFVQPALEPSDVLFVIDDSAAMAPFVSELPAWARAVIHYEHDQWHAVRWGVTTTSLLETAGCPGSGTGGMLLPLDGTGQRWRDVDPMHPADVFVDLPDATTCSTAPNEGMAAAVRALTEPLASGANAGFRREGAYLTVVFLSARDDASGGAVEEWTDALLRLVGYRDGGRLLRVFSALVPAGGCGTQLDQMRYTQLATETGGVSTSLCDPDPWQLYGCFHCGPSRHFWLLEIPVDTNGDGMVEDDIAVRIDGAEVAARAADGARQWSYVPGMNVVLVANDFVRGGSHVEFTYPTDCR